MFPMSKTFCSRIETLPHDVVECILERVAVESLVRFKVVSKQWQTTIESPYFIERQLKRREQSGNPCVLMVSTLTTDPKRDILRTLVLGSSSALKIPIPWEKKNTRYLVSSNSCDGLVCLYHHRKSGFVLNPTTRWYRRIPPCGIKQRTSNFKSPYLQLDELYYTLGFGKDMFTGKYKAVWLYNSLELGLENATTCEVFDFTTSSWRYVTSASPFRVRSYPQPVFVDGSLHWFTECKETKIVAFNLRTEAFQVISEAPFADSNENIRMCILENRLCVSQRMWPNQMMWSFDSGNKTWVKIFSIDLRYYTYYSIQPLALLDGDKKKRLLFSDYKSLLIRDLQTESDVWGESEFAFKRDSFGDPVCYFPSLFSIQ